MSITIPYRFDLPAAPAPLDTCDEIKASAGQGGPGPIRWEWNVRGQPLTEGEFAEFRRKGGEINRCEARARLIWQQKLDERHEKLQRRNKLFKLIVDVVAAWDPAAYLAQHRKIVRDTLALSRNARRRKLSGLSPAAGRHQAAIRLLHALVFDGLSQAEYCRRHHIDRASASRMLARLCKKEPGLRDSISAIRACVAMVSRLYRQQQVMFRNRERAVAELNKLCAALTPSSSAAEFDAVLRKMNKVEGGHLRRFWPKYGWNFEDVADYGYLTDFAAGRMRSASSGRFRPTALLRDEPFAPFDLHLPGTWNELLAWRELVFAGGQYCSMPVSCPDWAALTKPVRPTKRLEPVPDRYRSIQHAVRLKNGRRQAWDIARVLDHRPALRLLGSPPMAGYG